MATEGCRSPKPHQDGERVWKEIEAQASVLDKSEVWISGLSLSCDDGSACEVEYEVRHQPPYTSRHTQPPGILSSPIASSAFGTKSEGMSAGGGFNWGGSTRASHKGEAPVSPRPSTAGEGQLPSATGASKVYPRQGSVEDMRNAVGPTEVLQLWSNLSGGSSSSFGSADACDGTGFSSRVGSGGEKLSLTRPPPLTMTDGSEIGRLNSTAIMSPIDSPISVASCSSSGSAGGTGTGFQGSRRPVPNTCTSFEQVTRQVSVMPFSASSMSQSTVGPTSSSAYPLTLPLDDDDSWCANVAGYPPMSSSRLPTHSPSQRAHGATSKDWDASPQGNSEGVVTTPRSVFSPGFKDSLQGASGLSSSYAAGLRSATGRRSGSWVRLEQGVNAAAPGPRRPQRMSDILGSRALHRANSGKDDSESGSSEEGACRRASKENVPQEFDRNVHRTTSLHSVPDECSWPHLAPLNENSSDAGADHVPGHALAGAAVGAGAAVAGSPSKMHGSAVAAHSTNFANPGPVTLSPVPSVYKPMCSWGLLPDVRAARREKQ